MNAQGTLRALYLLSPIFGEMEGLWWLISSNKERTVHDINIKYDEKFR
ncbi:hypothetical protein SAMN06265379_104306 [Saccharicrinis carchari]|uniref:Uncharacterized protein n=1 Tax=Saccharicrinis carchari TaxID=1168039 RepID=A0A521D6R6_SACCC|nr:hypothetical protein SAMN06265379_104306 [Saccharicrinis carchari]